MNLEEYLRQRLEATVKEEDDDCRYTATGHRHGTVTVSAHRLAYILEHGELNEEVVRHTCDNPSCVNPDHLLEGTQSENMQDAADRGVRSYDEGSDHHNAKLSDDDVREIRRRSDESYAQLGREFGVSRRAIRHVAIGKTYQNVPEED